MMPKLHEYYVFKVKTYFLDYHLLLYHTQKIDNSTYTTFIFKIKKILGNKDIPYNEGDYIFLSYNELEYLIKHVDRREVLTYLL